MLFRVQNYISKELWSKISRHWVENSSFCKPVLASILAWKIKVDTIISSVIFRKSFFPIYIAISTAKFKFTQLLSFYPCSNIHLCLCFKANPTCYFGENNQLTSRPDIQSTPTPVVLCSVLLIVSFFVFLIICQSRIVCLAVAVAKISFLDLSVTRSDREEF